MADNNNDFIPPLISVVVPCWNAEKTVTETLRSIIDQTERNFELIVVDDGSTDGTVAVVEGIMDNRLKLVRQSNNGPAGARNTGIKASRGKYVAFLDSDDLWRPEFLEKTLSALEREPDAAMAAANLIWQLDPSDDATLFFDHVGFDASRGEIVLEDLLDKNIIQITATLIRKDVLIVAGAFDEDIRGPEDYDLWLRVAALRKKIIALPEPLGLSRRYVEGSVSKDNVTMTRSFVKVCEKFIRENKETLSAADLARFKQKYIEGQEYLHKMLYRAHKREKHYGMAAEEMRQAYKASGKLKYLLISYMLSLSKKPRGDEKR